MESRKKLLNLALIVASLFGYLEWGRGQSTFLFQAEAELSAKAVSDPLAVLHPFTLLPVVGQLALAWTLFQKKTSNRLTYFGIGGIGALLAFMFVVGVLGQNLKILLSTLPFLGIAALTVRARQPLR